MSEPAFPTTRPATATEVSWAYPGLSKREYAAIHIAAALEMRLSVHGGVEPTMIAARAVALADAVLKEAQQ